jgi:hypothetical protein
VTEPRQRAAELVVRDERPAQHGIPRDHAGTLAVARGRHITLVASARPRRTRARASSALAESILTHTSTGSRGVSPGCAAVLMMRRTRFVPLARIALPEQA